MTSLDIQGVGMTSQRSRDRLVRRLSDRGIGDARVLEAIRTTPRHIFVDEALADRAYEDTALPIGHGQTISQPWVVATMTAAAVASSATGRVLEIGTGSGYQAALLAGLVSRVYTVERIAALAEQARKRIRLLRLGNVRVKLDDGSLGWREHAPYDAVVVTAGASATPDGLLEQVADGGRLVIPLGSGETKDLMVLERHGEGWRRRRLGRVRFVPLLGGVSR